MESTTLFSIAPADLRALISDAVAEQLKSWQPPTPPAQIPDEYLGRKETARFLGVSTSALQLWDRQGKLSAVRIGRRVLYRRADIDRVLSGRSAR